KISINDQSAFVEKLLNMGHESVLEHASFTFGIEGVSRVLLAQLTRHRIASFSVQSQRYVSYANGFGYI
ncbi:FAD-dependent thymidylate synthase, partial [Klebsiella pneumoniae]|uniref:FAD-dependent thymidylate synthase n=1 Tax=Klebsiella pneumoniae TaxID=573 RepID=UPI0025A02F22